MATTQVYDPTTGQVYELRGRQWVAVSTQAPAAPAAAPAGPAPGFGEAFTGSVRNELGTMWRNVQDVGAGVGGNVDRQFELAAAQQQANEEQDLRGQQQPVASFLGGILPGVASMAIPMPGAQAAGGARVLGTLARLGANAGLGGVQSALGAREGDQGSQAGVGAVMGVAGMLGGNVAGRVMAARSRQAQERILSEATGAMGAPGVRLTGGELDAVEGAARAGMRLTPGQQLGNSTMRKFEASLASSPWTSAAFDEMELANRVQLNKLAGRAIGLTDDVDNVGPAVRQRAADQLADQFEEVGRRVGRVKVEPILAKLNAIADREATELLPQMEVQSLIRQVERGVAGRASALGATGGELAEGAGEITGEGLMRARSRVSRQMRDAFAANKSETGQLYGEVVDALDDAMRNAARQKMREAGFAAGGQDAGVSDLVKLYDDTRSQWNVLRALDRGGATPDGELKVAQLAANISRGDKQGFGRAQRMGTGTLGEDPTGDLYDALRFKTSRIGQPIVGDSGTATRQAVQGILAGGSITGAAARMGQRVALNPLVRAYARTSPEAAATIQRAAMAIQAAEEAGRRGSVVGAGAGRILAGG